MRTTLLAPILVLWSLVSTAQTNDCPAGMHLVLTSYGSYCAEKAGETATKINDCPVGMHLVPTSYGSYCAAEKTADTTTQTNDCPAGMHLVLTSYGSYCAAEKAGETTTKINDCPVGMHLVPTSYGSYCAGPGDLPSSGAVSRPSTVSSETTAVPSQPIEPIYGSGPTDLPVDFALDLQLGYGGRGNKLMGASETSPTPMEEDVFSNLVAAGFREPVPWRLTVVNDTVVNASSTAGGQVFLYGGLNQLVGNSRGLTAAVLSHEVAHTGLRHQVRTYLLEVRQQRLRSYYQARARAGDNSANWALIAFNIAAPLALTKTEREEEHQADSAGMLIMARAGYHPDFVFALHHLLLLHTGEQSKFAAFFSDHPRWETRDQRSAREYTDALAEFNRFWPNAASSPGGSPLAIAFVGDPASSEDKTSGQARVHVPLTCRNGDLIVLLNLSKDGRSVETIARDPSAFQQDVSCDKESDQVLEFSVLATAVAPSERKLKGSILVFTPEKQFFAVSKSFHVYLPKPK